MKAVWSVTKLLKVKCQVMTWARFETKNTTGRGKLVKVKDESSMNNSMLSEEYQTEGVA